MDANHPLPDDIETIIVGDLSVVGPCHHRECARDEAGTTVHIYNERGSDYVVIPLTDIPKLMMALAHFIVFDQDDVHV